MDKVNTNNIIRGTYGRVWMNGELLAEAKSFEGKATMNFEEVNLAGDLGTHQRYMGYAGEGTMVLHKVDSKIAKTIAEGIRTGILPDIKFVGKLEDPTALGAERVEFLEVSIDELMLLKFENKAILELEVPFKFADFNYIDMI